MRQPTVFLCLLSLALSAPALAASSAPSAKSSPRATVRAATATDVSRQEAVVQRLKSEQLRPAYPEALLTLAKLQRDAGDPKAALTSARAASGAFDRQVELHKAMSEVLTTFDDARAERTAARELGLQRDEANFLVGQLAEKLKQDDVAIQHYVMVVQSQPDQGRGLDAIVALKSLGWLRSPAPVPPAPVTSPALKP